MAEKTKLQEFRKQHPQYNDMSDDQLLSALHKKHYSDIPFPEFIIKMGGYKVDPTSGMSFGQKVASGAGQAVTDLGVGIKQLFTGSKLEAQEKKRLDAPLLETGAGKAGSFLGYAGAAAPTSLIPGANSILGATLVGGAFGAMQPVAEGDVFKEKFKSGTIGAALGLGTQAAMTFGAEGLRAGAKQKVADASRNAVRDATLSEGRKAGYVVPPSAVKPKFLNKRLESVAGKAAVGQEAAARNQQVTNALARKSIGLADDAPINQQALETFRDTAARPYREVAALSKKAAKALEDLKQSRFDLNVYRRHYDISGTPESLKQAVKLEAKIGTLEKLIDNEALKAGKPDLLKDLARSRTAIAKSWDIERALNLATGDVSAPILGRAWDKGKKFTGDMETIARMAQAFPQYMREGEKIPTPGVSKSEAIVSTLLGLGGYAAGGPYGTALAALPLASGPARSLALSRPYQALMATPNYAPGLMNTLGAPMLESPLTSALTRGALIPFTR